MTLKNLTFEEITKSSAGLSSAWSAMSLVTLKTSISFAILYISFTKRLQVFVGFSMTHCKLVNFALVWSKLSQDCTEERACFAKQITRDIPSPPIFNVLEVGMSRDRIDAAFHFCQESGCSRDKKIFEYSENSSDTWETLSIRNIALV